MPKQTGGNALLDVNFIMKKAGISERMKVADFGCGASGHFVFPASKLVGNQGVVYAVDILKTSLETLDKRINQENIKNIQTVWSDLEIYRATKIDGGSLDIGLLINTLYQSHKRIEVIRESVRMVKQGGKIMVVEWEDASLPFGPPAEERVKIDALKKVAQKLGLKMIEEFDAGEYHYGVIFEKL
ncbi:methyltransferase domain-containing protein [Candidatus Falkowbacteria bacterium]|nr:methyltransferase domain-containing protein [Candidatus Falkowbacteria bacterium]